MYCLCAGIRILSLWMRCTKPASWLFHFFLVVCMNVGYSVVAEFIIQHEDMMSITEALSIPQTAGMAPVVCQHQERTEQLSDILYGTSESCGDAKMEDAYTKSLMALQKLHVWLRFPNFRNHYMNHWALKKKAKKRIVVL